MSADKSTFVESMVADALAEHGQEVKGYFDCEPEHLARIALAALADWLESPAALDVTLYDLIGLLRGGTELRSQADD